MPPENNRKKSKLEELEENLYDRGAISSGEKNSDLRPHFYKVGDSWVPATEPKPPGPPLVKKKTISVLKKILIASVTFFVIAVGFAAYIFLGGRNIVSSGNINVTVQGPVSVAGGEPFSLQVTIENQNNIPLESADLLIEYPEGTRWPDDLGRELRRYRESLGSLSIGGKAVKQVNSVIFGEEGESKVVAVSLEYRVKGSSATFSKREPYQILLKSSPVTVKVDALKEISSDQTTEFNVEIVSNSTNIIKNLTMVGEYPFGFEFMGSDPQPDLSNNVWRFGDVKPGVRRTVKLRGKVSGQDGEERAVRFIVGLGDPRNDAKVATVFLEKSHSVLIRKPFIGLSLLVDGSDDKEYVVRSGRMVRGDIMWENNLQTRVTNLVIEVRLKGTIFDRSSVSAQSGFWRSIDNTILWDQTTNSSFTVIDPGETGRVSFNFMIPDSSSNATNPAMNIDVDVKGVRVSESQVAESISSSVSKKLKVVSNLALNSRALYSSGVFVNTGPIPPRAEVATSYTIVWTLSNSSNSLSGVRVSANLPAYVNWNGIINPSNEKITYNPVGGEVIWDVGDLSARSGFGAGPREVSFQVSLVPSLGQVGTAPVLIGIARAIGEDSFTGVDVSAESGSSLTTRISTDPAYRYGDETVTD